MRFWPAFVLTCALSCPAAAQTFKVLHTFGAGSDGQAPLGDLLLYQGSLYGTTNRGGTFGHGTIFRLNLRTGQETVLHNFAGSPTDGSGPFAGLVTDGAGNFYGTTQSGGSHVGTGYGDGTVFRMNSAGAVSLLHSFDGLDGSAPDATLTIDSQGNLYGTTAAGGSSDTGTVFKLDPEGILTTLHSFSGGRDGRIPVAGLLLNGGALYGTTANGGGTGTNSGVLFEMNPKSGKEVVLHAFSDGADGSDPLATLITDGQGNLYGNDGSSTCVGPTSICGTIFRYNIAAHEETVLYTFVGNQGGHGYYPFGRLVRDPAGNLYGTTYNGGTSDCDCGTVFKLDPAGNLTTYYSFTSGADSGFPVAGLVRDTQGNLYGVASGALSGPATAGTLFVVTP